MKVGSHTMLPLTPEDTAIILQGPASRGLMLHHELATEAALMRTLERERMCWTPAQRIERDFASQLGTES